MKGEFYMKKILSILFFITVITSAGSVFASESFTMTKETPPDKETAATPKIFVSEGTLYVQNVDDSTKVEIYSIVGIKVKTAILNNGIVDISDLNKGIYIVRVGNISQKIVIQ